MNWDWLKEIILFRYRAELHQLPPPRRPDNGQKTADYTADNVKLVQHKPTGRMMTVNDIDNIPEWGWATKDTDYGQRTKELTDKDMDIIRDKGLDILKARQLKPLWAGGMSIRDTSAHFRGMRGFGERTISDYFAVYSRSVGE